MLKSQLRKMLFANSTYGARLLASRTGDITRHCIFAETRRFSRPRLRISLSPRLSAHTGDLHDIARWAIIGSRQRA